MYEFEGIYFDWNLKKYKANKRKHKVSFYEAATAFKDDFALIINDEDHSEDEDRFVLLGYSKKAKLLTICHCYRGENESVVRIISARKANKEERKKYEGG